MAPMGAWAAGLGCGPQGVLLRAPGDSEMHGLGRHHSTPRQEDPHGVYSYAETPERADK